MYTNMPSFPLMTVPRTVDETIRAQVFNLTVELPERPYDTGSEDAMRAAIRSPRIRPRSPPLSARFRRQCAPSSRRWGRTTFTPEVREDGTPYASVLFFNGGMGASSGRDGELVLCWPSNISATPVEIAERHSPFLFHHKRLRPGCGGDGTHRGGAVWARMC